MGEFNAVTDADFEVEVLNSDQPVLVFFWADWCGPCRKVAPILEEIAAENADKITIVKLNIDENPNVPRDYNVLQIPAFYVFSGGEVVKQIMGAKTKTDMLRELSDYL